MRVFRTTVASHATGFESRMSPCGQLQPHQGWEMSSAGEGRKGKAKGESPREFTLRQKSVAASGKVFARFEGDDASPFDFDLVTGLGISAHSGLPVNILESPEPHQGHPAVPLFEPFLDSIQRGFKGGFCSGFRNAGILGDLLDQFILGHWFSFHGGLV
jgi:hypothetical protein